MAKKSGKEIKITLGTTELIIVTAVVSLLIGGFIGYSMGRQGAVFSDGIETSFDSNAEAIVTGEDIFVKYAADLGLDKNKFKSCLDSGKYTQEVTDDYDLAVKVGVTGTPSFLIFSSKKNIDDDGQKALQDLQTEGAIELLSDEENKTTIVRIGGALPPAYFTKTFDAIYGKESTEVTAGLLQDNDPKLGDENSPIIMLEFSDYQCPFCGRFWSQSLPTIKKDYIEAGKVLLILKDFPLSKIHQRAQKAAEAALCAGDQGKYWQYHDTLFINQGQWAS